MRCAVRNDAYQTVSAMTFVRPSGAVIDTSSPDCLSGIDSELAIRESHVFARY